MKPKIPIDYSRPNARKDYWCAHCGYVIKKGEPHRKVIYKEYGRFKSDRLHLTCYHKIQEGL